MSRLPRKFVFEPHEVGVYHGINRCVRRSMLCGWDPFTQRSYKHRKGRVRRRLMVLASVMAIDIEGFCTIANHLHRIVRNRPDVAANWSAEEDRPQVVAVVSAVQAEDAGSGRDSLPGRLGRDPQQSRPGGTAGGCGSRTRPGSCGC